MENEAAFFKILSDPTRLRLAVLLSIQGETCVCGLAEALDVPEYRISRHLGIMRSAGIVEARRCIVRNLLDRVEATRLRINSVSLRETILSGF